MKKERDDESKRIRQTKLRKMGRAGSEKPVAPVNKPVEVTDATFKEVTENYPVVVIDCWAPWCGPCQMVAPVIEELSKDYAGKITFGKLNVDENPEISAQYEIMSIPTLLVFKNTRLVDRIIGAMPKQMLEQKITHHL